MSDDFRSKGGKKAAIVAVIANCFLTVLNISVGFMSGSSALISEGAHTLTDIITKLSLMQGFIIVKNLQTWSILSVMVV